DAVAEFLDSRHSAAPSRLGQRYSAAGFLPEAGNTVVCHLDPDSASYAAVVDARARIMALPAAQSFLFTPIDSLHMTVFEGAIETRRTPDAWPADMDRDLPIDAVTDALIPRFESFEPPPRFSVRISGLAPTGLALEGATPADVGAMWAWRSALTVPFGYRHDTHDAYRFHMTFAYPVAWLPDTQLDIWVEALAQILAELQAAAPILHLRRPAFCKFADMTRFDELVVL
ncbi:MAG: DUF1868 domain-containing protein, partial [Pseudomonadota bacterium]